MNEYDKISLEKTIKQLTKTLKILNEYNDESHKILDASLDFAICSHRLAVLFGELRKWEEINAKN